MPDTAACSSGSPRNVSHSLVIYWTLIMFAQIYYIVESVTRSLSGVYKTYEWEEYNRFVPWEKEVLRPIVVYEG